ncbi:MAG: VWA domain-containing protein [Gemmatimonadaceae bacterium]
MTPFWMARLFAHPWLLPLAVLLPAAVVFLVVVARRRRVTRLARLADPALIPRLGGPTRIPSAGWRATRLGVAAALIGVALAGPRWGSEQSVVHGEGADVVLAVDASLSMLATDDRPSRLELAKQEIRRLRALSPADRFALLAFAGRSYILSPLTVDDGAIELFLDNLDPSIVGQAGSSLARTINQGIELLTATDTPAGMAIVVFSDGEVWETSEDVAEAASRAREAGVLLVTVGFGTPEGTTIPIRERDGTVVPKRDQDGAIVVTRYDAVPLRTAAEAAGGRFVDADESDKAGRIRAALNGLRTQRRTLAESALLTPRFQLFLLPAVILLLLDTMLADHRLTLGPRRRRRAIATLTGAALLLGTMPLPARADDVTDAAAAHRAGRYAQAIAGYRRAIQNGDQRPEVLYNLGTALLAADSLASAAEALERAALMADGSLRQSALFNLGLSQLRTGLTAEGGERDQALDAALATYKQVLIAQPRDGDARWNYELALREKEAQSGGGGGGGGGGQNDQQPEGQGGEQEQPGALGRQQAEQLLNSAAREERAVQGKRQRQLSPETPRTGKDW